MTATPLRIPFLPLLTALSLALPVATQEPNDPPPDRAGTIESHLPFTFRVHAPSEISPERVRLHFERRAAKNIVLRRLGSLAADDPNLVLEGDILEGEELGTYNYRVLVHTNGEVPADVETAIVSDLVESLAASLSAPMNEAKSRDEKRIAELERKAEVLELEYVELRRRTAAMPRASVDSLHESIVDMERQRLEVELDLRTEQAVQQPLRDQIENLRTRAEELDMRVKDEHSRRNELNQRIAALDHRIPNATEEQSLKLRTEIADLSEALRATESKLERIEPESLRLTSQVAELADELQKATTTVQRLTPRLALLDEMILAYQKRVAAAEAAEADRDLAMARAESVHLRMANARSTVDELRGKLDEMEPVRVELWK